MTKRTRLEPWFRPIAHRGLHDKHPDGSQGARVENSWPAFAEAIGLGFGIECDLQPAADGTPFVFHDPTFDRLVETSGPIRARASAEVAKLRYRGSGEKILTLDELLEGVGGRVPLLIEVKSPWGPEVAGFYEAVARVVAAYTGPAALMSFDPSIMVRMKELAPAVPRGIVSGIASNEYPPGADPARRFALDHLLETGPAELDFVSYHVGSLPTPVTRYVREAQGLALFCWTVRTAEDWRTAEAWTDAPTFEGPVATDLARRSGK